MLILLSLACSDKDTADSADDPCAGSDSPTLEIGTGVGDQFAPLQNGATVGLTSAPQGGFGVPVRVRTQGLRTSTDRDTKAIVESQLDTWLDGEVSASFLNEESIAYCQADGSGLMDGLVVGFDKEVYNQQNLVLLNGKTATLVVTAFDADGREATSTLDVEIEL